MNLQQLRTYIDRLSDSVSHSSYGRILIGYPIL